MKKSLDRSNPKMYINVNLVALGSDTLVNAFGFRNERLFKRNFIPTNFISPTTHSNIAQRFELENKTCVGRALIRYHSFVRAFAGVNEIMMKTTDGTWQHYILKR